MESFIASATMATNESALVLRNVTLFAHAMDGLSKPKRNGGSQSASDLAAAKTNEAHAKELFRHLAWIFAVRERVDDGNDQAMSDVVLSLSRRYNSTREARIHPQARRHLLERRGGS